MPDIVEDSFIKASPSMISLNSYSNKSIGEFSIYPDLSELSNSGMSVGVSKPSEILSSIMSFSLELSVFSDIVGSPGIFIISSSYANSLLGTSIVSSSYANSLLGTSIVSSSYTNSFSEQLILSGSSDFSESFVISKYIGSSETTG